ncbi:M48 family metalloprotease [Shimia abyssi]|uniref:Peptidase M48-like protein n=1 Tax=Shimia abyssi TaxID=1662395 RepID=A0A2P8F2W3_9RHOB|nr:M48 family metalloprotease [Shimia abyssi]PSL16043.1 peptidase M48-like protein [Shimia abyssi]
MKIGTRRTLRLVTAGTLLALMAACGTTYSVPKADPTFSSQASAMFAEEQNQATQRAGNRLSASAAASQFNRVARRVEPVAEEFCRKLTADREGFNCDIQILVDTEMPNRNAFQTYDRAGNPLVTFTLPMIADARNEHELAFVMGHEVGHHLAQHIKKKEQQAAVGAIIAGSLMAYAAAYDTSTPQHLKQQDINNAVMLGAAAGGHVYSQTYELESDVLGTYIAMWAGYDPVKGSLFFARPENPKEANGQLSFWGTHPPDEKRIATVLATVAEIEKKKGQ